MLLAIFRCIKWYPIQIRFNAHGINPNRFIQVSWLGTYEYKFNPPFNPLEACTIS